MSRSPEFESELSGTKDCHPHWSSMFEKPQNSAGHRGMQNYNLDLFCVSKCRWTGSGHKVLCNGSARNFFSGRDNSRVCLKILQFYILRCLYAPSYGEEEEDNDGFYEQLQLQSPMYHSVTCYWSLGIWMLKLEVISPGKRML